MIYPTGRFIWLAAIPALVSLFVLPVPIVVKTGATNVILEYSTLIILTIDAALLSLFIFDGILIPRRKRFTARRTGDKIFSVGYAHKVSLEVYMRRGLFNTVKGLVRDDHSEAMRALNFPGAPAILRSGKNHINYKLRVLSRGNFNLEHVYLTLFSPLGLVKKSLLLSCHTSLRVYPDLKAISRYVLLARKSHLGLLGIRRAPRAGGDNDFERLRDFQRDDEFRHIDWKSSAKHDKLIVRTYQMSQNQTLIFMLDCGRMMTAEIEGRSMLDYALNSLLLLARVALDQGDRVGLLAFSDRVLRYVEPRSGAGQHRRLVRAGYDLFAGYEESNFEHAFRYLNMVCRKRSLVCLIGNVIDEMNAEMMNSYLSAAARRHLPFAVLLKYRDIRLMLDRPPQDQDELFSQAAAADFLLWRQRVIQRLKNRGVLTLEAYPEKLDANLINEYLWIKARKLL